MPVFQNQDSSPSNGLAPDSMSHWDLLILLTGPANISVDISDIVPPGHDSWCVPINSLAPGRFWLNIRWVIFKQILVTDGWVISCEITLRRMSQGLTDDKSTLVQVMVWCRQATSHYQNQCWPRSMSPYGVTRPQWVNSSPPGQNGHRFTDDIFRCIFVNETFCILIKISLKFVPKSPIDNNLALV